MEIHASLLSVDITTRHGQEGHRVIYMYSDGPGGSRITILDIMLFQCKKETKMLSYLIGGITSRQRKGVLFVKPRGDFHIMEQLTVVIQFVHSMTARIIDELFRHREQASAVSGVFQNFPRELIIHTEVLSSPWLLTIMGLGC